MANIEKFPTRIVTVLIRLYQVFLSSSMAPHCRFTPSCSEYALQAFSEYGVLKGTILSLRRLGKCHPWHPGGVDPIPKRGIQV